MERPDGSRLTVVANVVPLKNDRGEVTGAMNCFYDITDRKRAETLLADQKAVLELAAAGAAMTDILQLVVDAALKFIDGLPKPIDNRSTLIGDALALQSLRLGFRFRRFHLQNWRPSAAKRKP